MKVSKRVKAILGIGTIVLTVVAAILWNTVLRQQLTSVNAWVLVKSVNTGEQITPDNLKLKAFSRTDLLKDAIVSQKDAIALTKLEARNYIPAGAQLLPLYFTSPELELKDDQFIFPVPNEWIIAVPDTIRRGDTAYCYVYSADEAQRLKNKANQQDASATPVQTGSIDISPPSATGTISPAEVSPIPASTSSPAPAPSPTGISELQTLSAETIQSITTGKKYQFSTVIAYCRDKSNKEVESIGESDTVTKIDRLKGSSAISHIEIIATESQIDMMQNAILQGYKFVILYR